MWDLKAGLILFLKGDVVIVYKRNLTKTDVNNLDEDEELIYYFNNNIAYCVNRLKNTGNYIIRKKKIFNNELVQERTFKTIEQVLKFILD